MYLGTYMSWEASKYVAQEYPAVGMSLTLIPAKWWHQSVLWSTMKRAETLKVPCTFLLSTSTVLFLAKSGNEIFYMQIVHPGIIHFTFYFSLVTWRVISTGKVEWNLAV